MTMYHVGRPSEFTNGFYGSFTEKNHSVLVIIIEFSGLVLKHEFSLEEFFIIQKIYLEPGSWQRSNFDDQRVIVIIDDDIHTGQPDDFVKTMPPFIDAPEARHQYPYLHAIVLGI
jgi:hypothetical protein